MTQLIRVTPEVKRKLDELARPGQTYDGVVRDILEKAGYPVEQPYSEMKVVPQ